MVLLGIKAFLLLYPRIAIVHKDSLEIRSYFFTAIFIMVWVIFAAWTLNYLNTNPDVTDQPVLNWIMIVVLSIISAVSIFFLTLTKARR